jgi:hypothetical protein
MFGVGGACLSWSFALFLFAHLHLIVPRSCALGSESAKETCARLARDVRYARCPNQYLEAECHETRHAPERLEGCKT